MKLGVEQLEPRNLAAVASFSFDVLSDAGSPISGVQVGDTFTLAVMAREHDPGRSGLAGISLNISWDPTVFRSLNDPFVARDVLTPHLPLVFGGTLTAGQITNLSAAASLSGSNGRTIGNIEPERFATLRFVALRESHDAAFSMSLGRSGTTTYPLATLNQSNVRLERQAVSVIDAVFGEGEGVCLPSGSEPVYEVNQ